MILSINILWAVSVFFGFYLASLYSYLLFHSITEIFSIAISGSIFMIAWNSRQIMNNNYLLFLGISYLFVGCIDLAHALAFKGMALFREFDANLPTQLWILGRYLESISLFAAPLFFKRRFNPYAIFSAFFVLTLLLLTTIFYWRVFPVCFIEGRGLTPFKIYSEYVISLILLGALFLLFKYREQFDRGVLRLISWSIAATIISELAFTFYISVYDLSNLIGHYFKIISFYLIYKAIIETGLRNPYSILLRELKNNEEKLQALAVTDPLTNLYNRRGFFSMLEQHLKLAGRAKQEMLLLYIDLDDMKRINDTLGHQAGDAALIETAAILRETFRETDIIGRTGGDEFAVLMLNSITSTPDETLSRLQSNIAAHNARGVNHYTLSFSVGVAEYDPESPVSRDELMARADEAMYEHKLSGKHNGHGSVNA
ncbi:MAG: GGDEF domain-containing protein [Deltaproteobacteria bacterium]|nr:GGDEF domain-containing protein [Deltaproteobacteria bacterium]